MTTPQHPPLLVVDGVSKSYGATQALAEASLSLRQGARHAVIGENGAGKSTLMKLIGGEIAPDAGTILLAGQPLTGGPRAARAAGVALVHQELRLVPTLSVAENICLGDQPLNRISRINRSVRRRQAEEALASLDVSIPPDALIEDLSLAQRQFVEIARAVRSRPRLIILDEPTTTLTTAETDALFALVFRLSEQGVSTLYISHRLPEVMSLCDGVTVLRDGRVVAETTTSRSNTEELVSLMVGRDLGELDRRLAQEHPKRLGPPRLTALNVSTSKVRNVSLQVRSGEILGLAGLIGAGRTELLRALCGLDSAVEGSVVLHAAEEDHPIHSYRQAVRAGVAFLPEDRQRQALAVHSSIADNVALPSLRDLGPGPLVLARNVKALAQRAVSELRIKARDQDASVESLSGGNQQKVALGKWLIRDPVLLLLDEPTRGVDVGAKADIHAEIRAVADAGAAVVLVSSDLPELMSLSERILVVRDGTVVGELDGDDVTQENVMRLAAGGHKVGKGA